MSKFDPATIEALAHVWASIDGKADKFREGRGQPFEKQPGGHYDGYMAEAEEMMERLLIQGFIIVPQGNFVDKARAWDTLTGNGLQLPAGAGPLVEDPQ